MPGAPGATILNKIPVIPHFSGTEREKDTVWFEQWYHAISDARWNFNEKLVRAAITKSSVGEAAVYHQGLPWMIFLKSLNGYMGLLSLLIL